MSSRTHGLVFVFVAIFSASCSRPLKNTAAAEQLRRSSFFSEVTTTRLSLFRNHLFPAEDLQREHRELTIFRSLGLIELQPAYVLRGKKFGAQVVLTQAGEQAASTGWQPTAGPGGEEAWLIPTAKKELLTVSIENSDGSVAECSFSWKWVPTDVGKALRTPATKHTGRAKLRRVGNGWSIELIEAN